MVDFCSDSDYENDFDSGCDCDCVHACDHGCGVIFHHHCGCCSCCAPFLYCEMTVHAKHAICRCRSCLYKTKHSGMVHNRSLFWGVPSVRHDLEKAVCFGVMAFAPWYLDNIPPTWDSLCPCRRVCCVKSHGRCGILYLSRTCE